MMKAFFIACSLLLSSSSVAEILEEGVLDDDQGLGVSLLQLKAERIQRAAQAVKTTALAHLHNRTPVQVVEVKHSLYPVPNRFLHAVRQLVCRNVPHCKSENVVVLGIACSLCGCIGVIMTIFAFFREDKEDLVTPLCPSMIVKEENAVFKMALNPLEVDFEVLSGADPPKRLAMLTLDWPDPFRPCTSGVVGTGRLKDGNGKNVATIVARNCLISGQALALCRNGCEIFGFVEPDSQKSYKVWHRTGVHMLTLQGDFETWDIQGVNSARVALFSATKEGDFIVCKIQQHVDAGLVISSIIATELHRAMQLLLQHPPTSSAMESAASADSKAQESVAQRQNGDSSDSSSSSDDESLASDAVQRDQSASAEANVPKSSGVHALGPALHALRRFPRTP
jgi:hypothetical protein